MRHVVSQMTLAIVFDSARMREGHDQVDTEISNLGIDHGDTDILMALWSVQDAARNQGEIQRVV